MSEWISVKERLPEKADTGWDYLVRVVLPSDGGTFVRQTRVIAYDFLDKKWCCTGMIVTHWMPLPEPPKEETT